MSFILDALKKSEQERQRAETPGVVELSYGHPRRHKPWWLMLGLVLLGLNCVLLLGMWLRDTDPAPAPATATRSAASSATPAPAPASPAARGEVRALDSEVTEATEAEDSADSTSLLLSEATLPEGPALVKPATSEGREANQTVINTYPAATDNTSVPTLAALGGSAALNLPEIRLDLHVYAPAKTGRFVFINGKKYSEGQTLSEGPVLESVTTDGAVLNYHGQRFSVPRR